MSGAEGQSVGEVEFVLDARAELAEGPVWDERTSELIWVDILAGHVHRFRPSDGRTSRMEVGQPVGAIALRKQGGLVLALRDGFAVLDPGATSVRFVAPVEAELATNRMNDGKCDPAGRFWAGTTDFDHAPELGALYRLDPDGRATAMLDDVTISNGLDWSPDGGTMYYVDTGKGTIDAFDFDVVDGSLNRRRVLVEIDPDDGFPDGLTVDAEGHIWLAIWGGWGLRSYGPDGTLERVIQLPVGQVTSCTFGGADLGDLYITSAWKGLSQAERATQPLAGGIFRCRPGVRGLSPRLFAG